MVDINQLLQQEELRPGAPYFNPAHIVSAVKHGYGVPYWMQGLPMASWPNLYIAAPDRLKDTQFHTAQLLQANAVVGSGAAPTSGIYTGVEDHCG
jgi:hypothetical protein